MSHEDFTPAVAVRRAAAYWRFARYCYVYANRATHHVLGALIKLAVFAYFIFAVLFLGLRYAVLPNIDIYKADVERIATRAIGQAVTIDTIYASWNGLRPNLFLGGVMIHDRQGREALKLPGVSATFSWLSVLLADVRLYSLEINRPDLDIQRDAQGQLFVGGIFVDPNKTSDGRGADWILSQREIVVREGRVRWNDARRGAPELALDGITVLMRNSWQQHLLAFKATPPPALAAPIDIRASFRHPFARTISDYTRWSGELYVDLRNTDLASWKPYVDYPFALERGNGGIRAWLTFDQTRLADLTADLTLSDVSTRLRGDLDPLTLTRVSGRVSAREEFNPAAEAHAENGTRTFGAGGHAISLTDFSLQTDDGLMLPATTLSESYVPAKKGLPDKTEIQARSLDLQTLAKFIERLPLPEAQHKMLVAFEPRGQLKDFTAQWQGVYPDIAGYSLKGQFLDLSLKAQPPHPARPRSGNLPAQAALPGIPGFENLSGRIDANDHGGSFALQSNRLKLEVPGYFADPLMLFQKFDMQAGWTFQGKDQLLLDVSKMEFEQDGLAASLNGKHLMSLNAQAGHGLGNIDLNGTVSRFEINKIGRYLPLDTPPDLHDWLVGALQGGIARDVKIRLKGELANFPFAGDKAKGEFHVAGKIDGGQLIYAPGYFARDGKAPLWPLLDKIEGSILFDRTRMEINASSGRTHGVTVSNVKATVPDLLAKDLLLNIEGSAAGPLHEMVRYTVDSPVAEMIAHFTDETRAGGAARLGLKLHLPLTRLLESKVQGSVQFSGNEVSLFNDLPLLQGVNGRLDFNERGLTLSGVKGNFVGGPVTVSGGSQRDDSILIKAEGSVTAAGLRRTYPAPAMQRLADRVNGTARYTTTISVKKKRPEVVVESNLLGVALDLPAPLKKGAGELMPLRFEMSMLPGEEGAAQRDELKLTLGPSISARYLRQKSLEKNASWRVLRGGIGVNAPPPQPDSGLVANVSLNSLSIDAWSDAVDFILDNEKSAAPAAAYGMEVAQYIEPDMLAARATELFVVGKKLDNVVVGVSHQKGAWQANIDSAQASGYLSWNIAATGGGVGRASARLSSLIIPKSAASDVTDLLEGKNTSAQMPGLDIIADNFELFGKKLGRLELQANNVLASSTREWRISKLSLITPDAELKATGKWSSTRDGGSSSSLNYTLAIGNAGATLTRLGFPDTVRGGKGNLAGELSWKGLPIAFDIPSLTGQIKLDLAAGQFLKVEPGAAKLLSVLSLQALPRRLSLDFRDVFSEGFAFDGITAEASITHGVARTENFKMRGVSATVLIDGSADIAKESQNLHVVVLPEVNAGAASVVYALAVNPVIGVGTFLAQLFLREPLIRAFTFEYQVTGPWLDPLVTKLDRKIEPAEQSAPSEVQKAG